MSEPLKPGQRAPEFKLKADDGSEIELKNFKGQNVILFFFPKAMTPG